MSEEIISKEMLVEYSNNYNGSKHLQAISNAISKSGLKAVAFNNKTLSKVKYTFSIDIDTMKVTNQKKSGRCWLFAGTNLLREAVAKKLELEEFELSQNYMAFWDKFEKINFFLESVLETLDEDTDSRIMTWILQNTIGDGGQWDMFVSLIEKYGAVPKDAMPETFNSSQTGVMNQLLAAKLREAACQLRKMNEAGNTLDQLREKKKEMLDEMYSILCVFFGEPPKEFDFEYVDKDKKFHRDHISDPKDFYTKYVDIDLGEYISIINAPTKDKPYGRAFTVKFLGNVKGGRDVLYINTGIEDLKDLAIRQLKDGETVWFGCDVGKMMDRETGIMDADLYRYDLALDVSYGSDKETRLDYRESYMTHAMVFTGVNLIDDVPNRWKVQNSWGDKGGEKGYFVMGDEWFDEYMYQVIVNKKYVPQRLLRALDEDIIELDPWDPMGSLAD